MTSIADGTQGPCPLFILALADTTHNLSPPTDHLNLRSTSILYFSLYCSIIHCNMARRSARLQKVRTPNQCFHPIFGLFTFANPLSLAVNHPRRHVHEVE